MVIPFATTFHCSTFPVIAEAYWICIAGLYAVIHHLESGKMALLLAIVGDTGHLDTMLDIWSVVEWVTCI